MKKAVLTVMFAVVAAVGAQAQIFVGGSVGLDYSAGKTKHDGTSTDNPSTFMIEFSPKAGYYFNDRLAAGLDVGFERSMRNNRADTETKNFTTLFGVAAFGRYHVLEVSRLALILEGSFGWSTGRTKQKTGSTVTDGDPLNTVGFFVVPVVSFSLTDRLSLEAYSDFLRLGVGTMISKDEDTDVKTFTNYFGFGANSADNDLYTQANGSDFSIGIVYKF